MSEFMNKRHEEAHKFASKLAIERGVTSPRILDHIRNSTLVQKTDEWLEARKQCITASDVSAVLGLNKYKSKRQVMLNKCVGSTFTGNVATRHGERYEDEAIRHFEKVSGLKVIPWDFGLHRHKVHSYVAGSPDGITECGKVIEIKCPYYRTLVRGYMPSYYECQCQVNAHIFGPTDPNVPTEIYYFEYWPREHFKDPTHNLVVLKRDPLFFTKYGKTLSTFVKDMCGYRKHIEDFGVENWRTKYGYPLRKRIRDKSKLACKRRKLKQYEFVEECNVEPEYDELNRPLVIKDLDSDEELDLMFAE